MNAASAGTYQEQVKLAADGLGRLTEFGAKHDISVIVENHGGLSSNGAWLAASIKSVGNDHCGTPPDFGNFGIDATKATGTTATPASRKRCRSPRLSARRRMTSTRRPFVTIDSRQVRNRLPEDDEDRPGRWHKGWVGIE